MEALQLGVTGFITPFTNIEQMRLNDGSDEIPVSLRMNIQQSAIKSKLNIKN